MTIRAASLRLVLGTALALPVAACTSHRSGDSTTPRTDHAVMTQQQMIEHQFKTVWDAVEALHNNWLQVRGTDSFGVNSNPSEILVYMDNNRLGGVETLQSVPVSAVVYVRHYDAVEATARWGVGHSQGVIFLSTH